METSSLITVYVHILCVGYNLIRVTTVSDFQGTITVSSVIWCTAGSTISINYNESKQIKTGFFSLVQQMLYYVFTKYVPTRET